MVFSFWNVAGRLELAASTCAKRVKAYVSAALHSLCAGKKLPAARLMAEGRIPVAASRPRNDSSARPAKGSKRPRLLPGSLLL